VQKTATSDQAPGWNIILCRTARKQEIKMPDQPQEEVTTTIDVKTAVKAATDYFTELYGSPFSDLALEEVERTTFQNKWVVTLGYLPARRVAGGGLTTIPGGVRQYKRLTVNAESGDVESMKAAKL
jgi:hypothetical protein